MANNCLLTKLKGVVDNDNLEYLDKIKIKVAALNAGESKTIQIYYKNVQHSPTMKVISGTATFPNGTQEVIATSSTFETSLSCPDTNDNIILVSNPEKVINIRFVQGADLDRFYAYGVLQTYQSSAPLRKGYTKLTNLQKLPSSLMYFEPERTTVGNLQQGDLSDFLKCKELRRICITLNKVITGNVSVLSELFLLEQIRMTSQNVSGSVNDLAAGFVTSRAAAKAQDPSIALPSNCRVEFQGNNNVTYKVDNVDTPVPYTLYIIFDESEPSGYRISTSA